MSKALNEKPHAESLPNLGTVGMTLDGHYRPPPEDKEGRIWVRTSVLIHASADELYRMWRDVEKAPQWQEQIVQVTRTDKSTSHWVMRSGDKTIEWDSEILADEPGRRIVWHSVGGDSDNAGEVIFESSPSGRGTVVTVLQEFRMSKLASAWETLLRRNPKQAIIENLRHFKALAETGEIPRVQGQPHGPRGMVAGMKESTYGEKIATPPGAHRAAK